MKVAHILGSLNIGGAEILELDLFNNAKFAGFDLIGIHRKRGSLYEKFKRSGISLHQVRPKNRLDIFYIYRLRKLLVKKEIDIAHCHQTIDALLVWLAVFGSPIKVVLTIHSNGYQTGILKRFIQYVIFRRLDKVFFVSQYTRSVYVKRLGLIENEKYDILYNGIDFKKFTKKENLDLRKNLNLSKDTILMGTVGNFTSGRDHLTICRFLKILSDERIQFHFIFVGKKSVLKPEYYGDCKQYCRDHNLLGSVTFAGSRDDVPAILSELDLFVYASEHDTFGIAVVEAMFTGLPVFVNDWPVMLEITKEGTFATVFESKNETDLMPKVLDFVQNSETYFKKADDAARYVVKHFSIETHISKLSEQYNALNDKENLL